MPKHGSGRVLVGGRWPDAEKKPASKEQARLNKRLDKIAEQGARFFAEMAEAEREKASAASAKD